MQDWKTSEPDTEITKIAQDLFGCWDQDKYVRYNREVTLQKVIDVLHASLQPKGSNFIGKQYWEFVERYCADESNKYAELVSPEFSQCLYLVSQIMYLGFASGFFTVFKKAETTAPYRQLYGYSNHSAGCFLNSFDTSCGLGLVYKGVDVELQIGMMIYDLPNGIVQSVYQLGSIKPILETVSLHSNLIRWNENGANIWNTPDSSVNSLRTLYTYLVQLEGVN